MDSTFTLTVEDSLPEDEFSCDSILHSLVVKLAVKHASCLTPCRQDFSSHPSQIVWNYLNTDLSNECGTRFDMPAPTVTPEIKKELQLLQVYPKP